MDELPLSLPLLQHYRSLCEQFDHEREDWLRKFRDCEVATEEYHRVQAENRKLHQEIFELQKALSDANIYLFQERKHLLATVAENDALKMQEREDRQRVSQLVQLNNTSLSPTGRRRGRGRAGRTGEEIVQVNVLVWNTSFRPATPGGGSADGPMSSSAGGLSSSSAPSCPPDRTSAASAAGVSGAEVTYFRERPPGFTLPARPLLQAQLAGAGGPAGPSGARTERGLRRETAPASGGDCSRPGMQPRPWSACGGSSGSATAATAVRQRGDVTPTVHPAMPNSARVVRTLSVPLDEERDQLVATIDTLRQQLAEQKAAFEAQVSALEDDRRVRSEEARARATADADSIERAERANASLRVQFQRLTEAHLSLERTAAIERRRLVEHNEKLREQCGQLQQEIEATRVRATEETRAAIEAADKHSTAYISKFREQAMEAEENFSMMKEKHELTVAEYEAEVLRLKQKCNNILRRYQELDRRRNLEIEGFSNDIAILRKQVASQEAKLARMAQERRAAREQAREEAELEASYLPPARAPRAPVRRRARARSATGRQTASAVRPRPLATAVVC